MKTRTSRRKEDESKITNLEGKKRGRKGEEANDGVEGGEGDGRGSECFSSFFRVNVTILIGVGESRRNNASNCESFSSKLAPGISR
jgi:hypothetical protein